MPIFAVHLGNTVFLVAAHEIDVHPGVIAGRSVWNSMRIHAILTASSEESDHFPSKFITKGELRSPKAVSLAARLLRRSPKIGKFDLSHRRRDRDERLRYAFDAAVI